ncbi:MAG: hypothetical protein HY303_09675 [Candidatus Wallbacteria bacterium]|nr:hypothetical protein [Candidatus Wallbacteria bacterium]
MNNPFDMGREMMITWEKSVGEMLERLSRSEGFLKHMSDGFGRSLDFKKQIDQQLQASLEALNVPTKADMQRILTYLLRIEQKLLDLEDRLSELGTPPAAAPVLSRTPKSRPTAPKKKAPAPKKSRRK